MKSPKKATVFTRISKIFSQSPILKHAVPPSHCSSSDTRSAQTVLRGSLFGFYPKTVFPVCGRRGGSVARGNFRRSQKTLAENARKIRSQKTLAENTRRKRSQNTLAKNARKKRSQETLARNARRKRSQETLAKNARKKRSPKKRRFPKKPRAFFKARGVRSFFTP